MEESQHLQAREVDSVSAPGFGKATMAPLDRWGTSFVWWAGAWVLAASTTLLIYFLLESPKLPNLSGMKPEDAKLALSNHQAAVDTLFKSLTGVFDLLVTKTALPIVTLMLGYLFGKRQS